MPRSADLLAGEFPPVYHDEWRRRVEDELGGEPFDEALTSAMPGGIVRQPLYAAGGAADPAGFPGLPPFVRGQRVRGRVWTVAQEYGSGPLDDVAATIEADAESGVGLFWLRHAGGQGLERLLAGIDLTKSAVVVAAGEPSTAAQLVAEASRQGVAAADLRGGFGGDPLASLAAGSAPSALESAFAQTADLVAMSRGMPGVRALTIDLSPYHDAGASAVEELAVATASGVELLRRLAGRPRVAGRKVDEVAVEVLFAMSVGGDFFVEIAKLRAARFLWAKVVSASGGGETAQAMHLHARTSTVTHTMRDPWVNLLRGTAESFAAALGGADSIVTAAYDEPLGTPEPSSRRTAVNTQHILREEANLFRVLDPAGGSHYLEQLTDELARAGWALFQKIERRGGMARCLLDGWIADRIGATASARRRDAARRKTPIVGVSEFPDLDEELLQREARAEKTRNADAVDFPPPFRPARPFEELRLASDRWRQTHGRRPRAFLVRLGEPRQYRARSAFTVNFLAAGGVEAVGMDGDLPGDAAGAFAAAVAFAESGAEFAVLCSSDEVYRDAVPRRVPALKDRGARAVILAGRGAQHEELFRKAGVDHFAYAGCDVVAVLRALWDELESSS